MLCGLATTDLPTLGDVSMTLICFSLNDVKMKGRTLLASDRTIKPTRKLA